MGEAPEQNSKEYIGVTALQRSGTEFDFEALRSKAIEHSGLLPREDAEIYNAIVLDVLGGSVKFRVGILQDLSPGDKRELSRKLKAFSATAIEFVKLEPMLFNVLLREAYETRNLITQETRRSQEQTRQVRNYNGGVAETDQATQAGSSSQRDQISFEDIAGQRLDLTDLDWYNDLSDKFKAGSLKESDLDAFSHVKYILQDFALSGGSDIHFESSSIGGSVRYRYQGNMYTRFANIPRNRFLQIVNSLCVLASRDPSNMKREPVESLIKLRIALGGVVKNVEFRFESLGSLHSPSITLRGQTEPISDINRIGFIKEQLEIITQAAFSDRGIIVVTGPTGSGKTNSQYSMLTLLANVGDRKIIEFGNPIEIESDKWIQVPITELASEKGTNIVILRNFKGALRMDPDVLAFTEIRNADEAKVAFWAANTGHIVFTTLHAADVEETLGLLFDFNLSRNVIGKGILAIVAQTLIRKLCEHCKKEDVEASEMAGTKVYVESGGIDSKGHPCGYCENGFSGRTVVAEVLKFDEEVKNNISFGKNPGEIVRAAVERGFVPMKHVALQKLRDGITTENEVEQLVELRTELNAEIGISLSKSLYEEEEFFSNEIEFQEAEYEDVKVG